MAWSASLGVSVGDATKETDYDNLVANAEYLQTNIAVEHDIPTSSPTADHLTITPDADSTRDIGETSTPKRFANVYTDSIGDSGQQLLIPASSIRAANSPCFSAYENAAQNNVTGDGTNYTVSFNTEVFDQGADFASDTFTASVTGRYAFSAFVQFGGNAETKTACTLAIVTSNRTYRLWQDNVNQTWTDATRSGSVIGVDMDAADTATVTFLVAGGSKDIDGDIHLTGVTICSVHGVSSRWQALPGLGWRVSSLVSNRCGLPGLPRMAAVARRLRLSELRPRRRLALGRWPLHVSGVFDTQFGDGRYDLRSDADTLDDMVHRLLAVRHR